MEITKLIEIANNLNRLDIVSDLRNIKERLETNNKKIILPLVGEFSSGKTSIINSLTDNKKLETASKATTATIFEIYFGSNTSYAEVIEEESIERFDNIEDIKNDNISEKKLVRIYDTSTKIPNSTILVDTPGLSSSDPRHKIALTSYLPNSDGILLVIDANQQITKSLLDFIETSKLSKKPLYLIINKTDTKTNSEIQSIKEYIAQEILLNISDIACISATTENLSELYELFAKIQKNKNEIINNSLKIRVDSLKLLLYNYAKELLSNLSSTSSLDELIDDQDFKLRKINDNINRLIYDASNKIEDKSYECKKTFEREVSNKLERIIATQNRDNCSNDVYSAVNQTSGLILSGYQKDIKSILYNLAKDRQSKVEAVPLQILENLDISGLSSFQFSDIGDLSELGHKWDKTIGYAAVAGAVIGTMYYTGGMAAILGTKEIVQKGGKDNKKIVQEVAKQTITIGKEQITKEEEQTTKRKEQLDRLNNAKLKIQESTENIYQNEKNRGIIEASVGWLTDNFLGKPQRKKAVKDYLDSSLLPEFDNQLQALKSELIDTISKLLREEAKNSTLHMEEELKKLINKRENEKDDYNKKVAELKEFISILN